MQNRRIIALLLTFLLGNNIFAIKEKQPRLHQNYKEAGKTLAGLAGTCIFGYLSYKTTTNNSSVEPSGIIEAADNWIFNNLFKRLLDLENNRIHQYIAFGSLPIITGIAAYECGKYTYAKIKNIVREKHFNYDDN